MSKEEEPHRASDYKDEESKEDELPTACQIQSEQPEDSSRRQSEGSQNNSRLQTTQACMANCAACVTRLREHVNKTAANGDTVGWLETAISDKARLWTLQSLEQIRGFQVLEITFKAIKLAECLQEHLVIIALSDFSLCSSAAQTSIFILPSSLTENVKIQVRNRTFTEALKTIRACFFLFCQCESRPWASETVKEK